MTTTEQVQQALPDEQPKYFCLSPFISSMQTTYGKTSPCAYGVTEWKFGDRTPKERWDAAELNDMRLKFSNGEQPAPCIKCYNEEHGNKDSLRLRMFKWYPEAYQTDIL